MKYKEFENHIADQFKNQSSDIDVEQLLGKLNLPSESSKKESFFFSWMMFGFGFVGAVLLGGFVWFALGSDKLSVEEGSHENIESLDKVALGGTLSNTTISDAGESENQVDMKHQTENSLQSSEFIQANTQIQDVEDVTSNTNLSGSRETHQNTVVLNKNINTSNDGENTMTDLQKELNNQNTFIPNNNIAFDNNEDQVSVSKKSNTLADNYYREHSTNKQIHDFVLLEVEDLNPLPILALNLPADMKPIECPQFHRERLNYKVGFEIGYSQPRKQLHPKTESSNEIFNERVENEESLEGIDVTLFGILAKKNIPISIKVGTEYFRLSERLHHESTITTRDTTVGIISTSVSSTGDTITVVYGDIITETTTNSVNKVHYNINQVNIPISLMYDLRFGRNILQLEGGVNFNVATWSSGLLLASQKEFVSLESLDYFKRNIGMSYFGKINFIRELNNGNSIYLSPRFQYNPEDWTSSSNDVGQKYQNWAIRVGAFHQF